MLYEAYSFHASHSALFSAHATVRIMFMQVQSRFDIPIE